MKNHIAIICSLFCVCTYTSAYGAGVGDIGRGQAFHDSEQISSPKVELNRYYFDRNNNGYINPTITVRQRNELIKKIKIKLNDTAIIIPKGQNGDWGETPSYISIKPIEQKSSKDTINAEYNPKSYIEKYKNGGDCKNIPSYLIGRLNFLYEYFITTLNREQLNAFMENIPKNDCQNAKLVYLEILYAQV